MSSAPNRIFLDTNVYITGALYEESAEAIILNWCGFSGMEPSVEVVVSEYLTRQILRVARRVYHKDWAGQLLMRIRREMSIVDVLLDPEEIDQLEQSSQVPREDVTVYLTAKEGRVDCFISANYELVQVLAAKADSFECLTPEEFVEKYVAE